MNVLQCTWQLPSQIMIQPPKLAVLRLKNSALNPFPCWSSSSSLPYRYMSYMPLIWLTSTSPRASQMTQHKESTCQRKRHGFDPWVRKDPLEKGMAPTPVSTLLLNLSDESCKTWSPFVYASHRAIGHLAITCTPSASSTPSIVETPSAPRQLLEKHSSCFNL